MAAGQLERNLEFLERDPENLSLLRNSAEIAFESGHLGTAFDLISRHQQLAPLPPPLKNLAGLVAIHNQDFVEGARIFDELLLQAPDEPAVRFNLAWCRAILGDWARVATLLDAEAVMNSAASRLKIQALHHLGQLDEALDWGKAALEETPGDSELVAALAAVALDAEDLDLASALAEAAPEHPTAQTTLGMLKLEADTPELAVEYFDKALLGSPEDGRALLGKGLALLAQNGDAAAAAHWLDLAAEKFGYHLGSWLAAGWAHFSHGDLAQSRSRFERALELDASFAESHGSLAVLDVLGGNLPEGRRRAETALRLDRGSFAGALAMSLILMSEGETASAERIRAVALNSPAGPSGQTIAQSLTRFARRTQR